jgi:beta-carotene 3-hydroxylase
MGVNVTRIAELSLEILLNLVIILVVAVFMELVAWFLHKYVMHGFLWILHEDHHHPKRRGLQKNDLFAVFFSLVSLSLICAGLLQRWMLMISTGCGVALYGVGYFLFHDIMFHRRIRSIRIKPRGRYLRRIIHAHAAHHQNSEKGEGISFGFLYASRKYDVVGA